MPRSSTRSIRPRRRRCRPTTSTPSARSTTPWVDCAVTFATVTCAPDGVTSTQSGQAFQRKLHLDDRLLHPVRPRRPQEHFAAGRDDDLAGMRGEWNTMNLQHEWLLD